MQGHSSDKSHVNGHEDRIEDGQAQVKSDAKISTNNQDVMDIDELPSPSSRRKGRDDAPLKFRCYRCKQVCHYAHRQSLDRLTREARMVADVLASHSEDTAWRR